MVHITKDKRELRSADLLADAAKRLLLDPEQKKLTVSLLSKEAGVSRTTFYRLFDEPDDVLQYAADREFQAMIRGYVDLIGRARQHDLSVPTPTRWYAESFRKHAAPISAMIRLGKSGILTRAHKKALREYAPILFPDMDPESDEFVFFVDMRTSVLMGAVSAWVETGQKASVDDIERYVSRQLKYFTNV